MLDFFATEPHFADHLKPVWDALPRKARGQFVTQRPLVDHVRAMGLPGEATADIDPTHPCLVASFGDLRRARKLGYRRFAYLEHGAGQSYAGDPDTAHRTGYAGGRDHEDVELFLVPGEYPAERWRRAYPYATVAVVGSAKVDALPRLQHDQGIVAVGFHWQCGVAPETRTAFGYYRPVLYDLSQRFKVIGHGHPRGATNEPFWPQAYKRLRIEYVPTFAEVCRRASVYVCDNSSTLFEFAATGRPVVVLNAPFYRKSVRHGGRFWDWATVGPQVDDPQSLGNAVDLAQTLREGPGAKERERVVDLVYAHRGDAAARTVAAITAWLQPVARPSRDTRVAVPA